MSVRIRLLIRWSRPALPRVHAFVESLIQPSGLLVLGITKETIFVNEDSIDLNDPAFLNFARSLFHTELLRCRLLQAFPLTNCEASMNSSWRFARMLPERAAFPLSGRKRVLSISH